MRSNSLVTHISTKRDRFMRRAWAASSMSLTISRVVDMLKRQILVARESPLEFAESVPMSVGAPPIADACETVGLAFGALIAICRHHPHYLIEDLAVAEQVGRVERVPEQTHHRLATRYLHIK